MIPKLKLKRGSLQGHSSDTEGPTSLAKKKKMAEEAAGSSEQSPNEQEENSSREPQNRKLCRHCSLGEENLLDCSAFEHGVLHGVFFYQNVSLNSRPEKKAETRAYFLWQINYSTAIL